ncbi:MAG: hypothetical protein LQ340_008031 [Diploschistes diacapsis]|nr:MAG: hypothetical protein LQ340_008031 [Diploschistes diacapsis]
MPVHEIVILGGSFGGVGAAHYLLRHTIPALTAQDPGQTYHITIVSPSTHLYFKIAGPRVIAAPSKISLEKVFVPIVAEFSTYPPSQFSFVQGKATGVNSQSQTVAVELTEGASQRSLPYSTLIVATGSLSDPLWTLNDSHTVSRAAFESLHASLPSARTIFIAGGGAAGVETAGEIAENFPHAKTTILSGSSRLLPRLHNKTSATAESKLHKLGVNVMHAAKVLSSTKQANGQTRVELSNGTDQLVDVYIDATGGRPNTGFLPHEWLDERGRVLVDAETLRGTGPNMQGVYAIGDAASYSSAAVMDVSFGMRPMCTSIGIDIRAGLANGEKQGGQPRGRTSKALVQQKYKPFKDTQMVPIGSKGGVMQVMGWRLPSFIVWLVKSRDFMIGEAQNTVKGASFLKA